MVLQSRLGKFKPRSTNLYFKLAAHRDLPSKQTSAGNENPISDPQPAVNTSSLRPSQPATSQTPSMNLFGKLCSQLSGATSVLDEFLHTVQSAQEQGRLELNQAEDTQWHQTMTHHTTALHLIVHRAEQQQRCNFETQQDIEAQQLYHIVVPLLQDLCRQSLHNCEEDNYNTLVVSHVSTLEAKHRKDIENEEWAKRRSMLRKYRRSRPKSAKKAAMTSDLGQVFVHNPYSLSEPLVPLSYMCMVSLAQASHSS